VRKRVLFCHDSHRLGEELERVFPKARGFVRPAFDEPEELARLLAAEGDADGDLSRPVAGQT
jgi:hypothetical protein